MGESGKLLLVAGGGALGAVARYGVNLACGRWLGDRLAWGTLAVNVVGCLIAGFILQLSIEHGRPPALTRLFLVTGFLGAFTTFSAFSTETLAFATRGLWGSALLNIAMNLGLCLLAAASGFLAARLVGG